MAYLSLTLSSFLYRSYTSSWSLLDFHQLDSGLVSTDVFEFLFLGSMDRLTLETSL